MRFTAALPRRRSISLTPLIDVIFILVMFFLLASTFSRFSAIELTAPVETGAAGSGGIVLVRVSPGPTVDLNGIDLPLDALSEALQDRLADDDPRVVIQAVGEATTQELVSVMDQVRAAGVTPLLAR